MSGRLSLAKRHVLPKASDAWVGIMYPSESGTRDRVLGPAHLAAASLGIGVPIVTAGVFLSPLFSPPLLTSLPLVMMGVFVANSGNPVPFLSLRRGPAGTGTFPAA